MNAYNVIRKNGTDMYRSSVERILRDIMRCEGESLRDVAENIDVSERTLYNALNHQSDLSAVFLARLGAHYGSGYLNPFLNLFGAQAAPIEQERTKDIHPVVARLSCKLAEASDPDGPGGQVHVPQERLGYLPDLKEVNRQTAIKIAEIEAVA